MAYVVEDRVQDSTTTTGTGQITVDANPPPNCRSFASVLTNNDTFPYAISHRTLSEWEDGIGTWNGSNQFTRTTVLKSSNSNSAVNFSAGTKDVYIAILADAPIDGGTF